MFRAIAYATNEFVKIVNTTVVTVIKVLFLRAAKKFVASIAFAKFLI